VDRGKFPARNGQPSLWDYRLAVLEILALGSGFLFGHMVLGAEPFGRRLPLLRLRLRQVEFPGLVGPRRSRLVREHLDHQGFRRTLRGFQKTLQGKIVAQEQVQKKREQDENPEQQILLLLPTPHGTLNSPVRTEGVAEGRVRPLSSANRNPL
jgi:hypothetical protein